MKINNIFLKAFLGLLFAFSGLSASAQGTSRTDSKSYLELVSSSEQGGHTSYVYRLQGDPNEMSKNIQWLENMSYDKLVYSNVAVDKQGQTCTITMAGTSGSERAAAIQSDLNTRLHNANLAPASAEEENLQEQFRANAPSGSTISAPQNGPGSPAEKALQEQHQKVVSTPSSKR